MKKLSFISISCFALGISISGTNFANAATITTLDPALQIGEFGVWGNPFGTEPPDPPGPPGTVEIVNLVGQGGNLENNAPSTGAVRLSTTADNSSRAEVRIADNFGTVGDFITHGSLSYDYYHESGAPNPNIAPAIKFEITDFSSPNLDLFATFIFEPIYNSGGPLTFDDWNSVFITGNSGNFWHTTIYNQNGLIFDNTLSDWNAAFNLVFGGAHTDTFLNANIFSISLGLGSGTPDQTGYIDNVNFMSRDAAGNPIVLAASFESLEVAAVPLPAALPLYGTGLALLGFFGWRKRRNK